MDDLKPCPFCGGEARIILNKTNFGRVWVCGCSKCGAKSSGYFEPDDLENYVNPYVKISNMVKDAVDSWNKRRYQLNA